MKTYALRLLPGQDIKTELINFTQEQDIKAGFIITGVGHVTRATLRMADASIIKDFEEQHEVVSLTGTLCQDDVHLHIALSDERGMCVGGHMKEGCIVGVTLEVVIGETDEYEFSREFDEQTGYQELVVKEAQR